MEKDSLSKSTFIRRGGGDVKRGGYLKTIER